MSTTYTVADLASFLDIFRQLVIKNPEYELVEIHENVPYTTNQLEELRRDMVLADLEPGKQMERSFEHYIAKHAVGTKEYAVAVYLAMDQLAHKLLIGEEGACNWANHRALENHGYRVRCGERDSFGWLTGVICCHEFQHVYG